MSLAWFLRMARWTRRPPSAAHVRLMLAVLALCAAIVAVEHVWGWPEALTLRGGARLRVPRP